MNEGNTKPTYPENLLNNCSLQLTLANFEKDSGRWVLCDFICPTNHYRDLFDADISIWVETELWHAGQADRLCPPPGIA